MVVAIDTNILLDVLIPDAAHALASKELLDKAIANGALVIGEVVYAELATQFDKAEELTTFLRDTSIRLQSSDEEALYSASRAWKKYSKNRGTTFACPKCGRAVKVVCNSCEQPVVWRQHIISDFLIGAHALAHADALATRDRGYYGKYFPKLKLLVPSSTSDK